MATNDPVFGISSTENATETRINELDPILDEAISLSMAFAVDFPTETLQVNFLQLVDYIKANVLNAQYLVGDIIIGTTTDTPAARGLSGTWTVIEPETSLNGVSLADASVGTVTGENDIDVPLLDHLHSSAGLTIDDHNHTINHNHPAGTTSSDAHNHIGGFARANGYPYATSRYGNNVSGSGAIMSTTSSGTYNAAYAITSTDTHTHTFDVASWTGNSGSVSLGLSGNTASAGTVEAKMNVQGKVLNVIFWQKIEL